MIKKDSLFAANGMTKSDRCIHTPGVFARQNLLYVQEVGRLQSLEPHRCVRENVDSYLFMIVLEGSGSLVIQGKEHAICAGDCALIDCMEHYEHISDEKDAWKLAWVHFNGHAAKAYYELFFRYNGEKNIFSVRDIESWNVLIGELLEAQRERNLHAELFCGEKLIHLMNCVVESVSDASVMESEQEKQLMEELRKVLNAQYANTNVLQEIESAFEMDAHALGEKFTKYFGISVEEYISSRRFNAAKEMLRFSIKPIDEVVAESGLGDLIVMQQMFRENEGMTAQEYRAKWAQWIR